MRLFSERNSMIGVIHLYREVENGEWRKEKGERRMKPFSEQNPMVGVIHLYREAENGE